MRWTPHTGAEPREGAVLKASGPQAQPACAGVRWAGIGAVAVRRDELDGTGAELTIPMTVPTSCRAYRADARSAGRDICGNQDLHVPVLQRARDMQVFLYIPRSGAGDTQRPWPLRPSRTLTGCVRRSNVPEVYGGAAAAVFNHIANRLA